MYLSDNLKLQRKTTSAKDMSRKRYRNEEECSFSTCGKYDVTLENATRHI